MSLLGVRNIFQYNPLYAAGILVASLLIIVASQIAAGKRLGSLQLFVDHSTNNQSMNSPSNSPLQHLNQNNQSQKTNVSIQSTSSDPSSSAATVTVNGVNVGVPSNGTVETTVPSNGQSSVNVNVSTNSSSDVHLNVSSSTSTNSSSVSTTTKSGGQ